MLTLFMLKTYLYIPDDLAKRIDNAVRIEKKSKAEVIRQALDKGLKEGKPVKSAESLLKLAEIGKKYKLKGIHDSTRIDELLWGTDWSRNE